MADVLIMNSLTCRSDWVDIWCPNGVRCLLTVESRAEAKIGVILRIRAPITIVSTSTNTLNVNHIDSRHLYWVSPMFPISFLSSHVNKSGSIYSSVRKYIFGYPKYILLH